MTPPIMDSFSALSAKNQEVLARFAADMAGLEAAKFGTLGLTLTLVNGQLSRVVRTEDRPFPVVGASR